MDLRTAIETRRSVRRFKSKDVSIDTIRDIMVQAKWAPSWKNTQTSHYIAVRNPDLILRLVNEATDFPNNKLIMSGAPVVMVQLIKDHISGYDKDGNPSTSMGDHFQSYDAGLSAQTFCLAAHGVGLGTVIMGLYSEKAVKEILDIDDTYRVAALIAMGYEEGTANAPARKDIDELLVIK